jgi:hypothetical protein
MAFIFADEEVFVQFKGESKKQYTSIWSQFRDFFPQHDFELNPPGAESSLFFNFLRQEKKFASTTLWTYYCFNSIMKRKYNVKLQKLPRLTMLIKGV